MNSYFIWSLGQLFPGGVESGFRGGIVDLILYSGPVVKIVLLILVFFSVLSWAIIFSKFRLIRKADQESREFLRIFWEGKQLSGIFQESKKLRHSPTAEVFRAGYVELTKLSQAKTNPEASRKVSDPSAFNLELSGVENITRAMRARAAYRAAVDALRPRFALYERANRVNEHPWLADLLIWRAARNPRILARMAGVLEKTHNPGHLVLLRGLARLMLPVR